MTALTIFTTFIEKNYILFAIQKDEAGVVCRPFMLNFLTSCGVYIKLGSHLQYHDGNHNKMHSYVVCFMTQRKCQKT